MEWIIRGLRENLDTAGGREATDYLRTVVLVISLPARGHNFTQKVRVSP